MAYRSTTAPLVAIIAAISAFVVAAGVLVRAVDRRRLWGPPEREVDGPRRLVESR